MFGRIPASPKKVATAPSKVTLADGSSGFINSGIVICLRYCILPTETLIKDLRFNTSMKRVFADVAFGPTKLDISVSC